MSFYVSPRRIIRPAEEAFGAATGGRGEDRTGAASMHAQCAACLIGFRSRRLRER